MNNKIQLSHALEFGFAVAFVGFNWFSETNTVRIGALIICAMICLALALPIFMQRARQGQGAENVALIALATNLLLQTPWMSGWGDFHHGFAVAFTAVAWISHTASLVLGRGGQENWHRTLQRQQRWLHS